MEGIKARPLCKEYQDNLLKRSEYAISALKTWKECMKGEDGEPETPMEKMLQVAIETFTELRYQWALSVGNPEEISGATLQKILDASLRILREEISKGRL